jgi:hypothetical protein
VVLAKKGVERIFRGARNEGGVGGVGGLGLVVLGGWGFDGGVARELPGSCQGVARELPGSCQGVGGGVGMLGLEEAYHVD